eukprot:g1046.t1
MTREICAGSFPKTYAQALSAFARDGDATPLRKIVCSDNDSSSLRHGRVLTNVCAQYYGLTLWAFENCTRKEEDVGYAEARVATTCSKSMTSSSSVQPAGCAWAGLLGLSAGDACKDSTTLNRVALELGEMTRGMFTGAVATMTTTTSSQAPSYISCGSDDEGEGHRCCMAVSVSGGHDGYCIDWNSGVPSRECRPENCADASSKDRYSSQVSCLDVFLDIDPKSSGACRLVGLEDCEDLARKYPSTCSVPKRDGF